MEMGNNDRQYYNHREKEQYKNVSFNTLTGRELNSGPPWDGDVLKTGAQPIGHGYRQYVYWKIIYL